MVIIAHNLANKVKKVAEIKLFISIVVAKHYRRWRHSTSPHSLVAANAATYCKPQIIKLA